MAYNYIHDDKGIVTRVSLEEHNEDPYQYQGEVTTPSNVKIPFKAGYGIIQYTPRELGDLEPYNSIINEAIAASEKENKS
ncbi:hypothetical protein [Flavihumibacter petaseus]|uniref:Uncharacterized protein n=1 Tax=Flavihumibacter petaseus NBRC 106054 TaxID=1220578 RepID=A0A0E9MXS5_9BACT|nr:hypothetical protein [Flavihumibacter petaseus]GAO42313.1 hypothetical protein FPE01S_01_13260 [Flavihumibacter petaseus NBRC 106054]